MAPLVGEVPKICDCEKFGIKQIYLNSGNRLCGSKTAISGHSRPETGTDSAQIYRMPETFDFVGNWESDDGVVERRVVELN